jgi:hypothetical protein
MKQTMRFETVKESSARLLAQSVIDDGLKTLYILPYLL